MSINRVIWRVPLARGMWRRENELLAAMSPSQIEVFRTELTRIADSVTATGATPRENVWKPAVRIAKGLTDRNSNNAPDFFDGPLVMELKTLKFKGFERWETVIQTRIGSDWKDNIQWDDNNPKRPLTTPTPQDYWGNYCHGILRRKVRHMQGFALTPEGSTPRYDLRHAFLLYNDDYNEFIYFEKRVEYPNNSGTYTASWNYRGRSSTLWVRPTEWSQDSHPQYCHSFSTFTSPKLSAKVYIPTANTANLIHISLRPEIGDEEVSIITEGNIMSQVIELERILGPGGVPSESEIANRTNTMRYQNLTISNDLYRRINACSGRNFAEKMQNYSEILTSRIGNTQE